MEGTEYRAAMEWVLVDFQAGKERWSKWVHASTLMTACPETELPEELTHALQVARVESSTQRADVSGQLTGLQQEYEAYRKRTKAATALLQERMAEASKQTASLRSELETAQTRVQQQMHELETIKRSLEEKEIEKANAVETLEGQLSQAKAEVDDLREQLEDQLIAQVEEARIRDELREQLKTSEETRTTIEEDLRVKEAALVQMEKALSLLQGQSAGETINGITTTTGMPSSTSSESPFSANQSQQQGEQNQSNLSLSNPLTTAVSIQVVSEPPSTLQMPADVVRPAEADHDRLLTRKHHIIKLIFRIIISNTFTHDIHLVIHKILQFIIIIIIIIIII